MKIRSVRANNHKRCFEVDTERGVLALPFSKSSPSPTAADPLAEIYVDPELGREGITYHLASGLEGSVHVDAFLDYNRDPAFMRDLLLYKLTLEAERCVAASPLSKREIIRRLGTSPAQLYRLLDATNYRKSLDGLLELFAVLDYEVELSVRPSASHASESRSAATASGSPVCR